MEEILSDFGDHINEFYLNEFINEFYLFLYTGGFMKIFLQVVSK